MAFTKEKYEEGLAALRNRQLFIYGGRTAVSLDELDFIALAHGFDPNAKGAKADTDDAAKAKIAKTLEGIQKQIDAAQKVIGDPEAKPEAKAKAEANLAKATNDLAALS